MLEASCLGFSGCLGGHGSPRGQKARLWLSEGADCTSHTWEVCPWATWGERGQVAPGSPCIMTGAVGVWLEWWDCWLLPEPSSSEHTATCQLPAGPEQAPGSRAM